MAGTKSPVAILDLLWDIDNSQREIEWEKDQDKKFSNLMIINDRLFNVVSKVGYKAAMGVAVTLTELIHLRSKRFYKIFDATQEFTPKIESLWAAIIDPLYLKSFRFDYKYRDENGCSTPYLPNWYVMRYMAGDYSEGLFKIHTYLKNLSMLMRHLTPNKKLFDKWFAETIRKTAEVFPCPYDYDDLWNRDVRNPSYDCSADAPIPREFFFDPEFQYSEEATKPFLNAFLQSLDYSNNPWLCTPEEMMAKGFKGTPYKI